MTVHYEIPLVEYIGNGVTQDFAFNWSFAEKSEIKVKVNGILLAEGVGYDIVDIDLDNGGTVRMRAEFPYEAGDSIRIYRQTPITQEVDYTDAPFPHAVHEDQMDKDTRILQELISGDRAVGGDIDLAAVHLEYTIDITNTGGEDATLLMWEPFEDKAGVFAGEVIPAGSLPADGSPTTKQDGYLWLGI